MKSYFARFAPPQSLDHRWLLAVEAQFYLLWPWLLLLGLFCLRKLKRYVARGRLIADALALAVPKAGSSTGCLVNIP